MATDHNFRIKNGLTVGAVEVIDSSGKLTSNAFGTNSNEKIEDVVADMITGSTHSNITVTYNDTNGTLAFSAAAQYGDSDVESYLDGGTSTPSFAAVVATTVNTGQGANELYAMNQNVRTTDLVTFNRVTVDPASGGANFSLDRSSTSVHNNLLFYTGGSLHWRLWQSGANNSLAFRNEATTTNVLSFTDNESTFSHNINAPSLNTGHGDNELYAMNQNVRTTDSPTFGGLTLNGGVDFNGNNINDINQINATGSTGWLDFNMDADNVYPQASSDNQTVLGSVTHMNFVGDSNANGTGGKFYWGYGTDGADNGTFTETMALDRSGNLTLSGTVDGRNVATDGTKLDTIATNADVTPSWVPSSDPSYLTSASTQTKYLRSDAADTATGQIFFDGGFDAHPIMLSGTVNMDNVDRSGFYNLYNINSGSTGYAGFPYGTMIAVGNDKGSQGFGLQIAHERTNTQFKVRGMNDTGSAWSSWATIWTSDTDGPSSGLNADLLDNQQGSYYLDYNNFSNTPTIPSLSGYATESYVGTQISNLVDSSPAALNTLNELAAAIGDDANFSTTVTNNIATKLPLAGGTLTGTLAMGANSITSTGTISSGAITSTGYVKGLNHSVVAGNNNGIGFWDNTTGASGSYAIYMSAHNGTYGGRVTGDTTSDYNIYFKMSAGTNRGFVFKNGSTNVAGIDGAGNGRFTGTITATGGNSTNWNTAYGWGNHASAGYLTSYTETDTLATVTGRGSSTSTALQITAAGRTLYNSNSHAYIQVGPNSGGAAGTFGAHRLTTSSGLDYTTYIGYDSYYSDTTQKWHALRSNLGRKWKVNFGGYHQNKFTIGTYDGGGTSGSSLTAGWLEADWTERFTVDASGGNGVKVLGNTVWHAGNDGSGSGLDADLLDGYNSATAATANTVVLRDGNAHITGNYILGSYFNASSGNSENPTIGQIWTQSTGDNYLRKSTPAHFKSQLGLLTNSSSEVISYVYRISSTDSTTPDSFGYDNRYQTFNYGVSSGITGPLITFGGLGSGYPMQLTGRYSGSGTGIKFRTRNGDTATWNSWYTLWHNGNDGSGSGLDADLLDGQQGSYYAPASHVHSYLPLAGGTITGNLNVNGNTILGNAGGDYVHINDILHLGATDSGDSHFYMGEGGNGNITYGNHYHWDSSYTMSKYSRYSGTDTLIEKHDTRYTHKVQTNRAYERLAHSTGYQIGSYNSVAANSAKTNPIYTIGDSYRPSDTSVAGMYGIGYAHSNLWGTGSGKTTGWGQYVVEAGAYTQIFSVGGTWSLGEFNRNGNKVWDAGNDGSGSGLDADTVDGKHKDFLMHYKGQVSGNWDTIFSQTDGHMGVYQVTNIAGGSHSNYPSGAYTYGGVMSWQLADSTFKLYAPHTGQLHYQTGWNNDEYSGWRKIWDTGNDGSGSGLDADLLDGQQGSYYYSSANPPPTYTKYLRSDVADSATGRITFNGNATNNHDTIATASGAQGGLEVYNSGAGNDAFMAFHAGADYALYFGLDADTNKLAVGGWSMGAVKHAIYHEGNKPSLATLGYTGATNANYITNNNQLTNGAGYVTGTGSITESHRVSGNAFATTGSPGSVLEYQQASGQTDTRLAPSSDWHNTIRMGHGNPYNYYSNTIAARMTGTGVGDLYTQSIHNNTANGWRKLWSAGNDGAGSGLDADLLDGQHGSYYAPASHVHSYLPLAGGTLTGTLTSRDIMIGSGYNLQRSTHQSGHFEGGHNNIGSTATKTSPIYTIGSSYNPAESTLSNMYGIGFSHINASFINVTGGSGWGMYVASDGDARIFLDAENGTVHTTGAYRVGSNIVWHAGNDGSGSGLDADLLDGQQGSYYAPKSGVTFTGQVNVDYASPKFIVGSTSNLDTSDSNRPNITLNGGMYPHMTIDARVDGSGNASTNTNHGPVFSFVSRLGASGYRRWSMGTAAYDSGALSWGYADNNANPHYGMGGNPGYTTTGSKMWLATTGALSTTSQGNLWGASNDGSGSSLDADLLDGQHGSYYYAASNPNGYITSSGSAGSVSGITSNRIVYGGTARKSTQVSTFAGVNEVTGFYFGSGVTGAPTTDWINYMHSAGNSWSSSNNYSFQLTHAFHSDNLWISRTTNGSQSTARKIWETGNDGAGSGLDADLLDGQQGSYYNFRLGGTTSGTITLGTQLALVANNYGRGLFGVYASTRYQHVWSMGTAYKTSDDGTSAGNMYGLTYTHTNVGTGTNQSISGLSHQLQHRQNGVLNCAFGTGIWTSGNVTAYSDIAVKTNLVRIPNALEKVCSINGYTYERTDYVKDLEDPEAPDVLRQAGVVAQEIEKVLPEVVSGKDGNKAVAYGNIVALLIESIKELKDEVDELKKQLKER